MKNYFKIPKLNIVLYVFVIQLMIFTGCDSDEINNEINTDNNGITVENSSDIFVENSMDIVIEASDEETPVSENGITEEKEDKREGETPEESAEGENITEEAEENSEKETDDISDEEEDIEESQEENEEAVSGDDFGGNANTEPGSKTEIAFNAGWTYAQFSEIHTGAAVLYTAPSNRNGIVIGVNAGHGTKGGTSVKTYCHPDMTPKVTGGSTAAGSIKAIAVSGGMSFYDGTAEATVTLRMAEILRDKLLAAGFDVLMIRDGADVQLDNVARTIIANNNAACHIAIHWDGDNLTYDKGCFYMSTPDALKGMEPVASTWQKSEALGQSVINGLSANGSKIYKNGAMAIDLTQTSYSTVPSIDIELGNAASAHDDGSLSILADGMLAGIKSYFNQ